MTKPSWLDELEEAERKVTEKIRLELDGGPAGEVWEWASRREALLRNRLPDLLRIARLAVDIHANPPLSSDAIEVRIGDVLRDAGLLGDTDAEA